MTATPGEAILLPEGTRLVHIGPPKTGTTTLQSALHSARGALSREGVHYAGRDRQPATAVLAVTGRPALIGNGSPPIRHWHRLVREIRDAREPRIVISSEFFADAAQDSIRTIVDDLDRSRVHIVVTLRPLVSILPSQWQQYVQSGARIGYDAWLDGVLNKPAGNTSPTFWQRHRHDRLIARWADEVGIENVTAVVLDDRDHAMILRVFERMLGLSDGLLQDDADRSNRSMTLAEIEMVRAFNTMFFTEGLGPPLHAMIMRFGAAAYMKSREPDPSEGRIRTPAWAIERAATTAREMVDHIVASGVRIVGDPTSLVREPAPRDGDIEPPPVLSAEVAAWGAMGVLIASGLARPGSARLPLSPDMPDDLVPDPEAYVRRPSMEPFDLLRVPTRQLRNVLIRRTLDGLGARRHALLRRIR